MSLVSRYPVTAFFVLACALSWWPWILYSFDIVPNPIVGFGPFLAALIVLALTEGKSGVVGLLLCTAPSTCRASIQSRWNRHSLKYLRRPANDD
jgi:hypothetical protein